MKESMCISGFVSPVFTHLQCPATIEVYGLRPMGSLHWQPCKVTVSPGNVELWITRDLMMLVQRIYCLVGGTIRQALLI